MPASRAKSKPQPMYGDLTRRQAVASRLQGKFAGEVSWKFGHASFETASGKVFCFITREGCLAMKLPAGRIASLLETGDTQPLRMGQRTMREWAVIQDPEAAASLKLLKEAQAYVESLPQEIRKRKPAAKKAAKKPQASRKLPT
ncbi:MAG TPA: hypothetical protein VGN16_24545, partial [Acidobacteriaceae bacterium]